MYQLLASCAFLKDRGSLTGQVGCFFRTSGNLMHAQGAGMNRSVTVGDVKLSIPGRIMRGIRMLLQLPGHLVNLIAFRAQQVMLGSAFTKLVIPLPPAYFQYVLAASGSCCACQAEQL